MPLGVLAAFGIFNDMLASPYPTDPFKGMLFGMWSRFGQGDLLFPGFHNNTALWEFAAETELNKAIMYGFWNVSRPVRVQPGSNATQSSLCEKIFATSYVVPGVRTVVSVASWANADANCTLNIDYERLGFNESQVVQARQNGLIARQIHHFQNATKFEAGDDVPVQSTRGYFELTNCAKLPGGDCHNRRWVQGGWLFVIESTNK